YSGCASAVSFGSGNGSGGRTTWSEGRGCCWSPVVRNRQPARRKQTPQPAPRRSSASLRAIRDLFPGNRRTFCPESGREDRVGVDPRQERIQPPARRPAHTPQPPGLTVATFLPFSMNSTDLYFLLGTATISGEANVAVPPPPLPVAV